MNLGGRSCGGSRWEDCGKCGVRCRSEAPESRSEGEKTGRSRHANKDTSTCSSARPVALLCPSRRPVAARSAPAASRACASPSFGPRGPRGDP